MIHPYIKEAAEQIDAAIFVGDAFTDEINRLWLREQVARWERGLKAFDPAEDEPVKPCST